MLLLGVGAGLSFPALMTLAMSGATPSDAGLASGLVNTTQQVGGALGLAVLATLVDARARTTCWPAATPRASALTDGYQLAFLRRRGPRARGAASIAVTVLRAPAAVVAERVEEPQPAYSEAA